MQTATVTQDTVHSAWIGPLLALSIVPLIYSGTRSPNRGHRHSTVTSLACGRVGMATRAPQSSRHNRHSDCSPSGSNYPYISKECWPLCEPRLFLPPSSFLKISAVSPAVETSHNFMTDTGGDALPPPQQEKPSKKTSGVTVPYSVLHRNPEGQGAVGQSCFLQTPTWD